MRQGVFKVSSVHHHFVDEIELLPLWTFAHWLLAGLSHCFNDVLVVLSRGVEGFNLRLHCRWHRDYLAYLLTVYI